MEEQKAVYLNDFYSFAHSLEKQKLFYFSLVYEQKTVVVISPKGNDEQKVFLGYKWSNRKGSEGIEIIRPGGKLYDDLDRSSKATVAGLIKKAFLGIFPEPNELTDTQKTYTKIIDTKEMLNFSGNFTKDIKLTKRAILIKTKFQTTELGDIASLKIEKGQALTKDDAIPGSYKVVAGGMDYAYTHNEFNRKKNVITISASGANSGFVNFWEEAIWASDCTTIESENLTLLKWIYFYLKSIQDQITEVLQEGSAQPHVYREDIARILVPLIDENLQVKIVKACTKIQNEYETTRMSIETYQKKIDDLLHSLDVLAAEEPSPRGGVSLSDSSKFDIFIGQRVIQSEFIEGGAIPVYSANVKEPAGYVNDLLIEDFSIPSVLWGIDGDWMTNFLPAEQKFYPTDHCGVLRTKTSLVNPRYLSHILEVEGQKIGFSRTLRASLERIKQISFSLPPKDQQDVIVKKILKLEKKISLCQETLRGLENKIEITVKKYLD